MKYKSKNTFKADSSTQLPSLKRSISWEGRLDGGVWRLQPPGGTAGPGEAPEVSALCRDPGRLGPPDRLYHLILEGQPWKAAWRS